MIRYTTWHSSLRLLLSFWTIPEWLCSAYQAVFSLHSHTQKPIHGPSLSFFLFPPVLAGHNGLPNHCRSEFKERWWYNSGGAWRSEPFFVLFVLWFCLCLISDVLFLHMDCCSAHQNLWLGGSDRTQFMIVNPGCMVIWCPIFKQSVSTRAP